MQLDLEWGHGGTGPVRLAPLFPSSASFLRERGPFSASNPKVYPKRQDILLPHEAHQLEAHRLSCSLRSRANQTASIPRGKQERQFSPRS